MSLRVSMFSTTQVLIAGVLSASLWVSAQSQTEIVEVLTDKYASYKANRTYEYETGIIVEYYDNYSVKMCSKSFILLPGVNLWPNELRVILYALSLVYCFLGIAIISDVFMGAIDVITSQEKTVKLKDRDGQYTGQEVKIKFWNDTVANLTLMALGSSAPEILLATIETAGTLDQQPGELGPSTIVGSAAFNLLAISAVCIQAIPDGQVRRIKDLGVFLVTASWSVWAYLWMLIVLQVWTPGVVTVTEALLTLLAMPLFVMLAFAQDRNWWMGGEEEKDHMTDVMLVDIKTEQVGEDDDEDGSGKQSKAQMQQMLDLLQDGHIKKNFIEQLAQLSGEDEEKARAELAKKIALSVKTSNQESMSVAKFRTNARRMMVGQRFMKAAHHVEDKCEDSHSQAPSSPLKSPPDKVNLTPFFSDGSAEITDNPIFVQDTPLIPLANERSTKGHVRSSIANSATVGKIFFSSGEYRVLESAGSVSVIVKREGATKQDTFVEYYTEDGTGMHNKDYYAKRGLLHFSAGETSKTITVDIVDDDVPEPDVTFGVRLKTPMRKYIEGATKGAGKEPARPIMVDDDVDCVQKGPFMKDEKVTMDYPCYAQVIILDDDEPGFLSFSSREYKLKDSDSSVTISVLRSGGACGDVSCEYFTSNGSAIYGHDYDQAMGVLEFAAGELEKTFEVKLCEGRPAGEENCFHVHLKNPKGLAQLAKGHVSIVRIVVNESFTQLQSEVLKMVKAKEKFLEHTASWREQFRDAMSPGVGVDELGEETEPGTSDYILHFLTFGWKVLFAFVPPTNYYGGWVTFVVSLVFIGALTAVVGELASLFGCSVGLKDSVTAITFVALGTSLPDTFASRQAAVELPHADASIGNVTGSNTVNVLLGLGMPWTLGALYYFFKGDNTDNKYCVPSGALGYSVLVFTVCAVTCISLLLWRRNGVGGELGGTQFQKAWSSALLLCLWLAYLVLSSLQSYGHIKFGDTIVLDNYGCDCSKSWSSKLGCPTD